MQTTSLNLSAIILTYNEEIHIKRCIDSLVGIVDDIVVVDSNSSDSTLDICKTYSQVRLFSRSWINYSDQFNWAIENTNIQSDWIMRIDADEYLSEELILNISRCLISVSPDVSGIEYSRLIYFMNKPLRKGGMYPIWHTKIFRNGKGICEDRWMDERIIVNGKTIRIDGDVIDYNLNNIYWWISKHNGYAVREAIDNLNYKYNFWDNIHVLDKDLSGTNGSQRRLFKSLYLKLPLLLRPFFFWIFRYIFQLGILEGKRGFIWNFFQCLWYRFLVDYTIIEIEEKSGGDIDLMRKYIWDNYNYKI